jgi:hypothetical protein
MLLSLAPTDKGLEILFGGVSDGDIASLIGNFFMGRGFVLGSGSPIAGVYETGSAVGRALLGGFVKRQKYSVNIWTDEHGTHARVHSEMSGASGSVVGVVRERRGRDEVKTALQWYLQSTMGAAAGMQQPVATQQTPMAGTSGTAQAPAVPPTAAERFVVPRRSEGVPSASSPVGSLSVELARLSSLHREGQLTDSEFEAAKRQLLGR